MMRVRSTCSAVTALKEIAVKNNLITSCFAVFIKNKRKKKKKKKEENNNFYIAVSIYLYLV